MKARQRTDLEAHPPARLLQLQIEDESVPLSARFSIRFLEHPGRPATPVLYYDGRRVIRAWTLRVEHAQPADGWGISGGRD